MSALKQEVIDKFRLLDKDAQHQVLTLLNAEVAAPNPMTLGEWLAWADETRAYLKSKYGENYYFNSVDALHEAREERLNALMGGR